jgi:hypothetical protein
MPPDLINESDPRYLLRYLCDFHENIAFAWNQVKLMIVGKEGTLRIQPNGNGISPFVEYAGRCREDELGSLVEAQSSHRDTAQRSPGMS